ncbi:PaaI family thioesterase [Nocardia nova]|uniref:Thioesterase n=1 Tax=Nocardia nova TaxID=37330 RepID=A0A2S6ADV6_9NOCA|nr:PaaI family thioesterase [Nocardia nova]PPJ32209.1 thioesterase [Nocardia nova]
MSVESRLSPRRHVLLELGFATRRAGDEVHGSATIVPELHAPGTAHLRTSILATWADTVAGLLASLVMHPRVPVTLELDVNLYRPAPAAGQLEAIGRTVKVGRSVFVAEIDFAVDGEPLALAGASFMVAPDPDLQLPRALSIDMPAGRDRLTTPLAERLRCERVRPGVAVLPRTDEVLNAAGSVNGGLIAVAAEEAVLSLAPGDSLSFLGLRYLQPAKVGPVTATATLRGGVGRVDLRDTGADDRLATIATARTFGVVARP